MSEQTITKEITIKEKIIKEKTIKEKTIKEITIQQARKIYEQDMPQHFPKDEIKPWKHIERMWGIGAYRALGMFCEDTQTLIGYAFFAQEPEGHVLLLDYFAMLEENRGQGLGALFLRKMKQVLGEYDGIIFETEDEQKAETEAQLQERQRRNAFYERQGMQRTPIRSSVYGVGYMIWCYPFTENEPKPEAIPKLSADACRKYLADIYRYMLPGDKFEKYVTIV